AQGEGPVRGNGQAADRDPGRVWSAAHGQDDLPGDGAAGGDELVGGVAEVANGENVVAGPTAAAACGVNARIGTAARVTWSRTRDKVPAPPVATHADSSPTSTTAQSTGPNAARASSRSTFRPGWVGAGAGLMVGAVTGETAAAAGCWPPRSASWPTSRSRRTAG